MRCRQHDDPAALRSSAKCDGTYRDGTGDPRHYDCITPVAPAASPYQVEPMKQSDLLRENAENCLQLAERSEGQPAFKRYSRMAQAWTALATEQDWLDGE